MTDAGRPHSQFQRCLGCNGLHKKRKEPLWLCPRCERWVTPESWLALREIGELHSDRRADPAWRDFLGWAWGETARAGAAIAYRRRVEASRAAANNIVRPEDLR